MKLIYKKAILFIALITIGLLVFSCEKEEEMNGCETLISYGGDGGEYLTAHYSDGTTVVGTKNSLPFPEKLCHWLPYSEQ